MERIEEFYSELYDSDHAVTIQTDPKEVPPIMAWEVEAALRKIKMMMMMGSRVIQSAVNKRSIVIGPTQLTTVVVDS